MTIKNWYKSLLTDQVLVDQVEGLSVLKPTRLESKLLNVDWSESYRLIRLQGLDSVLSSFAFKIVHHLLPTQDRVKRLGLDQPSQNGFCQICRVEVETLCHAFFECQNNLSSGKYLLTLTQKPGLMYSSLVRLQFGHQLPKEKELAMMYLITTGLSCI